MNQKEKDLLEKVLQAAEIHDNSDGKLNEAKASAFWQFFSNVRTFFSLLEQDNVDDDKIERMILGNSAIHMLSELALGSEKVLKVEIKEVKEMLLKEDIESAV